MSIPDQITDNPTIWIALLGAVITVAASFGLQITQDQVHALGLFFAALWAVFGLWSHKTTVPKTPSAEASPASIQRPQPGS